MNTQRYRPRIATTDGEIEFRVADDGAWVLYEDAARLLAMLEPERVAAALPERSGDVWPNGYGCPACDGTGFVSDEQAEQAVNGLAALSRSEP